jgi:putative SOS response-associated peptidase YedK
MCGRYVSVQGDADLLAEFDAIYAADDAQPDIGFNVAPTEQVRAVVNRRLRGEDGKPTGEPVRQLRVVSWGLVPSWSKDRTGAARMINARAETVGRTPAFRKAFASRRCLIPADGWYEWKRGVDSAGAPAKQAFYMTPKDGHGLAFAGLYEFWSPPGDESAPTVTTCSIVTSASVGALAEIHDRMPLVLARESWARWLDPGVASPTDLLQAWDEADGEHIELRPVSSKVNSVKNDDPSLIEPVELVPESQPLF